MATVPCDGHGTVRPGRLCGAYLALLTDGVRARAYKRFCPDCMHELLVRHSKDWKDRVFSRDDPAEPVCRFCGEVMQTEAELRRFYGTLYVNGTDRRDFTSMYCPKCAEGIRSEFDLAAA